MPNPWKALPAVMLAVASCGTPRESHVPIPPERARALVVRVGFRAAGASAEAPDSWRHLPLESPVRTSGREAEALDRMLSMPGSGSAGDSGPALRSYEIAIRAGEPALLVIEDAGGGLPFTALVNTTGKSTRTGVTGSALTELLRKESYEALRASMSPPLRPLEWSHAALAGFLDSVPSGVDAKSLRAELLSALRANPEPSYLAEVLIEKAAAFPPGELEPLLGEEALAPKLLALTGLAARGNAKALEEILTLSLEHFGSGTLFERSLRTLFPKVTNPGLHARHSGSGPARGSFVEAVRAGARGASYEEREGWALER